MKNTIGELSDAMGQRIAKTVTNKNVTTGDKFVTTYYVRDPQGNVLAVYEHKHGESGNGTFTLTEQHLYGASRLGMTKPNLVLSSSSSTPAEAPAVHYELTNHLGNVLSVITPDASDATQPAIESLTDYYPFGMEEPGRSYNSNTFRFGYTGHEKENDLAEGVYTTQYRLLDTRLGRWMSVDPLFAKYPDMSSYNYCGGNPMVLVDPDGGSKKVYFCQKMTSLQDKDYERNRNLQYFGNYILKDVKDVLFFVGHGVGDDGQKICMDNIDMRTFLQGFTYRYYSSEEFSKYVSRYVKSQQEFDLLEHPYVIVLVSCNTGKGDNKSFAAELSSDMYALVIAPSDIVSYNKSTKRTRIKNNGVWNVFVKGVKVDSFSGDTQLNDYFSGTMNGEELCEKYNFNFDGFTVEAEAKSKKSSNEPSKKTNNTPSKR